MLYAKLCAQSEQELLQALKRTSDSRWYRRLKIIHLSAHGKSVSELATLFDLCAATVRAYLSRYNAWGLTGLKRRSSGGAPIQIPLTKAEWEDLLHQSPAQFARLQTGARNWTQELVQRYLQEYHQIAVTQQAISAAIKRHKVAWNRGKLRVTSPDPVYTVKRERIETVKKSRCRDLNES
jgi:transposase